MSRVSVADEERQLLNTRLDEFSKLLDLAGLKSEYHERGFCSGALAVRNGDHPADVCDALVRNRPEMFDPKVGRKQQIKQARKRGGR